MVDRPEPGRRQDTRSRFTLRSVDRGRSGATPCSFAQYQGVLNVHPVHQVAGARPRALPGPRGHGVRSGDDWSNLRGREGLVGRRAARRHRHGHRDSHGLHAGHRHGRRRALQLRRACRSATTPSTPRSKGFKTASKTGHELVADGRLSLDFSMELGALSETVVVTAHVRVGQPHLGRGVAHGRPRAGAGHGAQRAQLPAADHDDPRRPAVEQQRAGHHDRPRDQHVDQRQPHATPAC